MKLLRTAAHVGVVLLHEVPANLILRNTILLVICGGVRGSRGGRRLEAGRAVDVCGGVGERVGVSVLRRVAAVDRSLGRVGHCEMNETWRLKKKKEKSLREKSRAKEYVGYEARLDAAREGKKI